MIVTCVACDKTFNKAPSQIKKTNRNFCSTSCAATYNNKLIPKRKKMGRCIICNCPIHKGRKACNNCKISRRRCIDNLTKGELKLDPHFHQVSRVDSRRKKLESLTGKPECEYCGYNTFIEIAHIKSIAEFSDDVFMNIINDPINLLVLCPNHHLELDTGILSYPFN